MTFPITNLSGLALAQKALTAGPTITQTENGFNDKLEREQVCKSAAYNIMHSYTAFLSLDELRFIADFNKKPKNCDRIFDILSQVVVASHEKEHVLDKLNENPNLSAQDRALVGRAYSDISLLRDPAFRAELKAVRLGLEAFEKLQTKNLVAAVDAHQGDAFLSTDEQDILRRAKESNDEAVKYRQQLCDMNDRAAQAWEKRAHDKLEEGKQYQPYPGFENTGCLVAIKNKTE